ncbi:MAG: TonB family protein [Proteobacteria bacterium]|nr:TonB family protein [Pseudomonadota bacterium]
MRLDSPVLLALAGTVAVHLAVITLGDILIVTHPPVREPPAPHIELVDLALPPPPTPPEMTPVVPTPTPEVDQPKPTPIRPAPVARPTQTPSRLQPPPTAPVTELPPDPGTTGGDEVVKMDDIAPGATGNVPVAEGKNRSPRTGRGGSGGGTGSGTGSGSGGDAAPTPMSVATIKTPAKPKGDFGYFDAGRDYPAPARQLGIEGVIKVKLVVDATGKVKSSVLLTRLGYGLDELALARAAKLVFEPARDTDDQPVASLIVWTFNMTLPK